MFSYGRSLSDLGLIYCVKARPSVLEFCTYIGPVERNFIAYNHRRASCIQASKPQDLLSVQMHRQSLI